MLANLPAKRAVRQIFPNLTQNPAKNKKFVSNALNRKKMLVKQKNMGNARGFKIVSTSTTINTVGTNLALRKKRNVENLRMKRTADAVVVLRRTRSSLTTTSISKEPLSVEKKTDLTTKCEKSMPESGVSDTKKNVKSDLGNVFRRRTKAVVKKISNSFRRGNKKRLLRTLNKSTNDLKNNESDKLDKTVLKPKNKRTFLRNLSFRRSKRNAKKIESTDISKNDKNDKCLTKLDQTKVEEDVVVTSPDEQLNIDVESVKGMETNDAIIIAEIKETSIEPVIFVDKSPPKTPRLKRKPSFKTIINDLRAKCQRNTNNTNPLEEQINALATVNEDLTLPTILSQNSITSPLSVSIEPLNEPLNLCKTSRDNEAPAPIEPPTTTTTLASPNLQPPPSQLESISPRRRPKKLSDCIAMLTGKIQEKLGVPFIDETASLLPVLSTDIEPHKASTNTTTEKIDDSVVNSKIPEDNVKKNELIGTDVLQRNLNISTESIASASSGDADNRKRRSRKTNEISKILLKEEILSVDQPALAIVITPPEVQPENLTIIDDQIKIVSIQSNKECEKCAIEVKSTEVINENIANEETAKINATNDDALIKPAENIVTENISTVNVHENKLHEIDSNISIPCQNINTTQEIISAEEPKIEMKEKRISSECYCSTAIEKITPKSIETVKITPRSSRRSGKKVDTGEKSLETVTKDEALIAKNKIIEISKESHKTEEKPVQLELNENKTPSPKRINSKKARNEKTAALKDVTADQSQKETVNTNISVEMADIKPITCNIVTESIDKIQPADKSSEPKKAPIKSKKNAKSSKKTTNSIKSIGEPEFKLEKSIDLPTSEEIVSKPVEIEKSNQTNETNADPATAKNVKTKTLKTPQNNIDSKFESSDEELLPWDPESGFLQEKRSETTASSITVIEKDDSTPIVTVIATATATATATASIPKAKKKRKNELAQIIADQMLESFKEVDKSRIEELKKIHDLSLSSSDDLLSTSLSNTPTPKRKSKKIFENIEPKNRTQSPKINAKHVAKEISVQASSDIVDKSISSEPVESKQTTTKKRNNRNIKNKLKTPTKLEKKLTDDVKESQIREETVECINTIEIMASKTMNDEIKAKEIKTSKAESFENVFLGNFTNELLKDTLSTSSATNIQIPTSKTEKIIEKNLFTLTTPTKPNENIESNVDKQPSPLVSQILDDFSGSSVDPKPKSPPVFGELLFSQQNMKTSRLNDIISHTEKAALSKIQPLKNKSVENLIAFDKLNNLKSNLCAPFMASRWDGNAADDKTDANMLKSKIPLVPDNKINFWSRNIDELEVNNKQRLFGVVKSKAKKIFNKMSKNKLKKSIKSSISSSSSTSSSSSAATNSLLKKPLLRPSILSCNNLRETVDIEKSPKSILTKSDVDVFDSLKMTAEEPKIKTNIIGPSLTRKIGSLRRKAKTVENSNDTNPKSPIESNMNIAKIAIALEKSNRKEQNATDRTDKNDKNLNDAFIADQKVPVQALKARKSFVTKAEKKSVTPALTANQMLKASMFSKELPNDESSQDTMISEIVSKIREKAERTDSDDDMCLAEMAKELGKKLPNAFSTSKSPVTVELSETVFEKDFSGSVPNVNAKLQIEKKDSTNQSKPIANKNDADAYDDDENTNTELIDMDLEDDVSVYTAFSQDTSMTSSVGGQKKKRKKRSILMRSSRRSRKQDNSFVTPSETYFCDICSKSFRNQGGLTTHKTTITHISKLSEQEFLSAKKQEESIEKLKDVETEEKSKESESCPLAEVAITVNDQAEVNIEAARDSNHIEAKDVSNLLRASDESTNINAAASPISVSPKEINSYISQCGFEPISSPEQNSRYNTTPKHSSSTATLNSRLTLSQEERLFYECCSMLKGSDRTVNKSELLTKPITPKSNEQNTNIAHSAQSPRSHSSPRPGIPTLDLNQFSDISSDSNPAYSCPQIPSSSKTQKVFSLDSIEATNRASSNTKGLSSIQLHNIGVNQKKDNYSSSSNNYPNSSMIVRNYPDTYSDMGDSFPSSQDASESENYAQTILERSNHMIEGAVNSSVRSGDASKLDDSGYSIIPMQATLPQEMVDFRTFTSR